MLVTIGHSELDGALENAELEKIVFSYEKRSAFFLLARLNVLLSFYSYADDEYQLIQNWLLSHLIDDDLLRRFRRKFPNRQSLAGRLIFHRQQFLLMMKMLLLDRKHAGEHDITQDVGSRKKLCKACLIINDPEG